MHGLAIHNTDTIVKKLLDGGRFALFNDGKACYFENGEKMHYSDLWMALRIIHQLPDGHCKTLHDLCPGTFEGSFSYKFSKHKWKKLPSLKMSA